MPELPTGTVTFLMTDIDGSTRLWEQHPQAMEAALTRHDALGAEIVKQHHGVLVKHRGEGDSLFAVFSRAIDAVAAAADLQRALVAEAWPAETPLRVRMALHTGDATVRDGDYYGAAVNRCARLRSAAHGGQVLLSLATRDIVRDQLPDGVSLRDLGRHRLKDLQEPEQILQLIHPDLPGDFPPLRSLEAFAHNLPHQLTSFVDREGEMAEIKRLLATTHLLTLMGAGGCGKTRLALQVAAELVEEYAHGAWLVEFAGLADPALVPQTVAAALGVREEPGRPLTETLADYLRPRSLLLVLDNCEHLVAAAAQLAAALLRTCPSLRILATSREILGIAGETPWRVPPLSVPDLERLPPTGVDWVSLLKQSAAARLFLERAAAVLPSFTITHQSVPAVAQTCQRLDGIPLAIELAAARVKVLSVEQIARRLDDRFRLLTGGSRTALPRQQTLRATIDWSHELLAEIERTLLRRLSLFAGGFTLEAAEAVCAGDGIEEDEVLELLARLVDKSLVLADQGKGGEARYRLLETIRQYGAEKLQGSGEGSVLRERHGFWFLRLAEQAEPELEGPDQGLWLERLEVEHDNLRAALGWARESPWETGLRLAGSLWLFWEMRGHFTEGRGWLEQVLEQSGRESAAARAKALTGAGTMAWHQGDYQRAAALHQAALALYRELEDKRGIAFALNNLAVQATWQSDYERAWVWHEESLALYRELKEKRGIVFALNNLGVLARDQRDLERAAALLAEGLALSREMGDKRLIAAMLVNLGEATKDQGDHARAATCLMESLALSREIGDKEHTAFSLVYLGLVVLEQGDYTVAGSLQREGLVVRQELGDKRGVAECLEGLARAAGAQGEPERAARLFGAAEALREGISAPMPPANRPAYDRDVAATRARLGDEAFVAAWAKGRAMSLDESIRYALEEPGADPPAA